MRLRIAARLTATVALAVGIFQARPLAAHPLHTSLAEVVYDPASKEIRISLRVFVDDLTKAATAYSRIKPVANKSESPLLAYARAAFVVEDRYGRAMPLASCGGKQVGDLVWICFHSPAPAGADGLRIAHRVLFDLYSDQVNIVQATYGRKKSNLLFTRGDGFKKLD